MTEYSTNAFPESTSATPPRNRELPSSLASIPSAFLLPNGYPDV